MTTVFLDSNILVSALVGSPQAAPVQLVDWLTGSPAFVLTTGRCCVQEIESVLARKLPRGLPLWKQFLAASGIAIVPCPRRSVHGINAKDAAVVSASIAAGAEFFVTGDKRLLAEMRASKSGLPKPVTARELLEALVL